MIYCRGWFLVQGDAISVKACERRAWSTDVLHEAIASAKNSTAPIALIVENGSFNETYKVDYHGGERYPYLERDNTKPDVIADVIK